MDGSQDRRTKLPWGRAVALAATSTLNLTVAGVAGLGAAALHSVPVLGLGALAYCALVAWDLTSAEHWRRAVRGREEPRLPDPAKLADPAAQKAARALRAAQAELERARRESPEGVQGYLGLALGSVAELEAAAARLLARAEDLHRYLATQDEQRVWGEVQDLDRQIERTRDEEARSQFQSAREARVQQTRTLGELRDAQDRVHANLERLVATFEGLPARIVHMRALDAQAADALGTDVGRELDRMNTEVAAFEETLKPLAGRVHA